MAEIQSSRALQRRAEAQARMKKQNQARGVGVTRSRRK